MLTVWFIAIKRKGKVLIFGFSLALHVTPFKQRPMRHAYYKNVWKNLDVCRVSVRPSAAVWPSRNTSILKLHSMRRGQKCSEVNGRKKPWMKEEEKDECGSELISCTCRLSCCKASYEEWVKRNDPDSETGQKMTEERENRRVFLKGVHKYCTLLPDRSTHSVVLII